MFHYAEFACFALKGVNINTAEPQKLGSAGAVPLGVVAWLTVKNKPSSRQIW